MRARYELTVEMALLSENMIRAKTLSAELAPSRAAVCRAAAELLAKCPWLWSTTSQKKEILKQDDDVCEQ